MYLFKKKVDLYADVISPAIDIAKRASKGESVVFDNEPCAKYKGGYTSGIESKYYTHPKITVNCLDYDSFNDGVGGLVTLYEDQNEEWNYVLNIRVVTPDLFVKHKYSKLDIGDTVKVCGLVDLMVIPGFINGIFERPTSIYVTILE